MKHRYFLMLVCSLLFSVGLKAQNGNITVCDGLMTNFAVPIEGYNVDSYTRSQFVYPASLINSAQCNTGISGSQIRQMTFYLLTPAQSSWGNAHFQVRIKEVNSTAGIFYNGFANMGGSTLVYDDTLNASGNTMTINFSQTFQYYGGYLIVEIENITPGSYSNCQWYGIEYPSAGVYGHSPTSVYNCTATACDFLPKATFTFSGGYIMSSENTVSIGPETSSTSTYRFQVNNYYNYSLTQTIINENEIGRRMKIKSISYKYVGSEMSTKKGDVTIWIKPTTKNVFADASDIDLLGSNAVKVYHGPLNCSNGWNEIVFNKEYIYYGSGDLMVIVDDNSGRYNGSSNYTFATSQSTGNKTLYWYSDGSNPDPNSSSFSGSKGVSDQRVLMRLNGTNLDNHTALKTIDFHDGTKSGNYWSGTGYSTGTEYAHDQTQNFSYWNRVPNIETATLANLATNYPFLSNYIGGNDLHYLQTYLGGDSVSCNNGFMLLSMIEQRTPQSGCFNAYINLGVVDASDAVVVDVRFFQYYKRYYDECYVEYRTSSTGTWHSVQINLDIDINTFTRGYYTVTLPIEAAGNEYLETRIRWFSNGARGNAYGYWWIIDDVQIIPGEPNRLQYGEQTYVQGGYGLLPQNLEIIPAWHADIYNNGANTQTNLRVGISCINSSFTSARYFGSATCGDLPAEQSKPLLLDPAGYISDPDVLGWYCGTQHPASLTSECDPIPSSETGDFYLRTYMYSDEGLDHTFDPVYYKVNGIDPSLGACRWGKDNGVLAYSPFNYCIMGYVYINGNWYYSYDPEDVPFYHSGYQLTQRYTTGATVPAGWAIVGVELVPSPVADYCTAGAKIRPVLLRDNYSSSDGSSINFDTLSTGVDVHQVTADELNTGTLGRNANGYLEYGNYNTVRIMFNQQHSLQPNTSYRIGYEMVEEGLFAVATSLESYRIASPTNPDDYDTIIYFRDNQNTKKYATLFNNTSYDVRFRDPVRDSYGFNSHEKMLPMIRMLVGPATMAVDAAIPVDFNMYPNPASSQLTLDITGASGTAQCSILDINGREVWNGSWDASQVNTVDVSNFSKGVYMVHLIVNGNSTVKKLVVR